MSYEHIRESLGLEEASPQEFTMKVKQFFEWWTAQYPQFVSKVSKVGFGGKNTVRILDPVDNAIKKAAPWFKK